MQAASDQWRQHDAATVQSLVQLLQDGYCRCRAAAPFTCCPTVQWRFCLSSLAMLFNIPTPYLRCGEMWRRVESVNFLSSCMLALDVFHCTRLATGWQNLLPEKLYSCILSH